MPEHAVPPDWQAITDRAGITAYHLTQQVAEALRALSAAHRDRLIAAPLTFPPIAIADAPMALDGYAVTLTVQIARVPGPGLSPTPPIPYTPPPSAPPLASRRARPGRRPGRRRRP